MAAHLLAHVAHRVLQLLQRDGARGLLVQVLEQLAQRLHLRGLRGVTVETNKGLSTLPQYGGLNSWRSDSTSDGHAQAFDRSGLVKLR